MNFFLRHPPSRVFLFAFSLCSSTTRRFFLLLVHSQTAQKSASTILNVNEGEGKQKFFYFRHRSTASSPPQTLCLLLCRMSFFSLLVLSASELECSLSLLCILFLCIPKRARKCFSAAAVDNICGARGSGENFQEGAGGWLFNPPHTPPARLLCFNTEKYGFFERDSYFSVRSVSAVLLFKHKKKSCGRAFRFFFERKVDEVAGWRMSGKHSPSSGTKHSTT